MTEVFLDTAFAIALSSPNDRYHHGALRLADQMESVAARVVTTRAVLLEIGNALAKHRHRAAAVKLLNAREADPTVEIAPPSDTLYQRAVQLYAERTDKEWGLIDCLSFVVMRDRGITEALTIDDHFVWLRFRDGSEGVVDLGPELMGPVLEPLRNIEEFQRFRVDPTFHTLVWPNGADVAPEFLHRSVHVTA